MAARSEHGESFARVSFASAELLLRSYWGAVEGIAELLTSLGPLGEPHGIELARMKLREKPMRQLMPDTNRLLRLLNAVEGVPEWAGPIREYASEALK
jgi:hypothetical protein